MLKQIKLATKRSDLNGFSLAEATITTAIIGTLSSIAYPVYLNATNVSTQRMAQAEIVAIPPIISAYTNETGILPTTWDDLASISVIATNSGPATGDINTPIILATSKYELTIEGPTESIYTLTATPLIKGTEDDEIAVNPDTEIENIFGIQSCFNISNGASDIKRGKLSEIADTLNCG
jgi:Tfp pilus assembly protein PilE